MPKNLPVQVGHKFAGAKCCGRAMQYVDSGIWECGCGCHVMTTNKVVDTVRRCAKHA